MSTDTNTISSRTKALTGDLEGRRVRITVPYREGQFAEIGTAARVAYPLVEVDVGDQMRYRHVDDVELMD